jgi:hypothetical protein
MNANMEVQICSSLFAVPTANLVVRGLQGYFEDREGLLSASEMRHILLRSLVRMWHRVYEYLSPRLADYIRAINFNLLFTEGHLVCVLNICPSCQIYGFLEPILDRRCEALGFPRRGLFSQ